MTELTKDWLCVLTMFPAWTGSSPGYHDPIRPRKMRFLCNLPDVPMGHHFGTRGKSLGPTTTQIGAFTRRAQRHHFGALNANKWKKC